MIYIYVIKKNVSIISGQKRHDKATQITDQHLLLHHSSEVSGHLKVGIHLQFWAAPDER